LKNSHVKNTVGPWARQKLDGLEAYLDAYTTALSKQNFDLYYIDAFAGSGKSRLRGSSDDDDPNSPVLDEAFAANEAEFIEGSPRRALGLSRPFKKYFFFDADPVRAQILANVGKDYPGREFVVKIGDGNHLIRNLLPGIDSPAVRGVAFLDPYGQHLHWQTIEALAATKHFEVIINFPLGMAINRLITKSGDIPVNWRRDLDAYFGGNDWESLVYDDTPTLFGDTERQKVENAGKRLLEYYVERLRRTFGHAATPSLVRNTRGTPIYYMLWAGPHRLGHKIADHILRLGERIASSRRRT
jgi:three-Cys-motif partner protein